MSDCYQTINFVDAMRKDYHSSIAIESGRTFCNIPADGHYNRKIYVVRPHNKLNRRMYDLYQKNGLMMIEDKSSRLFKR